MPGHALILPPDPPLAHALRALRWTVAHPLPGDSRPAALADALRAAEVLILHGPPDALDPEAQAAVIARRAEIEQTGRLLLVVTPNGAPPRTELLGLTTLVPIAAAPPARLAQAIHDVARRRGLGPTPPPKVGVAVVAEPGELGAVRDAVAAEIGRLHRVTRAIPCGLTDVPAADLTVVLVGICTDADETDALGPILARPHAIVLRAPSDLQRADLTRHVPGLRLWQSLAHVPPITADEAPARAREAVSDWIRAFRPVPDGVDPSLLPWEERYLKGNLGSWACGGHRGIDHLAKDASLTRDALYVPLHAALHTLWQDEAGLHLAGAPDGPPEPDGERRPVSLERAVSLPSCPHLTLVGEAGSGKTVLLQRIATAVASLHHGKPIPSEVDADALRLDDLLRVPILLEASAVASAACEPDVGPEGAVARAVFHRARNLGATEDAIRAGLAIGRYLLLIDALDEVADPAHRQAVLTALTHQAALPGRVVLTTRPSRHTGAERPDGFARAELAGVSAEQRAAMIARWSAARSYRPEDASRLAAAIDGLGGRLGGEQGPLANPLFVTALMYVWHHYQRLPRNTADLYHAVVEALCAPRGTIDGVGRDEVVPTRLRAWLQAVALAAQRAGGTALPLDRARLALLRAGAGIAGEDAAGDAIDLMIRHTGLFRYEDQGVDGRTTRCLRPWHRSFQEFLAACAVAGEPEATVREMSGLALDPTWQGCLRFLLGAWLLQRDGEQRARDGLDRWTTLAADASPPLQGRMYALAAGWLDEYREPWFSDDPRRTGLPAALCARYAEHGKSWRWQDRVAALRAVGRIGPDPRLPDPRTSLARWVELPAGAYRIGDESSFQAVKPQPVHLPRQWLLNSHVTVADVRPFLADPAPARWWAGLPEDEGRLPRRWSQQQEDGNVPVWGVSWWWAVAFCRWATVNWQLPVQGVVTLPTSAAWEAAVRGPAFPWGEGVGTGDAAQASHAWEGESPEGATPAGAFPAGDTRGLLDPVGNLWCWTSTPWAAPGEDIDFATPFIAGGCPVVDDSSTHMDEGPHVVRGGSWLNMPSLLRCALREGIHPWVTLRTPYVGFRVCVRPVRELDP